MKGNTKYWRSVVAMIGVILGFVVLATMAQARTTTRPISDFVNAQGTFCIPCGTQGTTCVNGCGFFVPPIPNFFGWFDAKADLCASVDFAGLEDTLIVSLGGDSLGTETDGTVIERPLADGRAEVTVLLHTENALTWVVEGADCSDFPPLVFGHRPLDVLSGGDFALGESFLKVVFINTEPGAMLPDLIQLAFFPEPGQELRSISIRARADGTLRAALGVAEDTPGRVEVTQTGLFMTSFKGATADGFPVEKIILRVVGK